MSNPQRIGSYRRALGIYLLAGMYRDTYTHTLSLSFSLLKAHTHTLWFGRDKLGRRSLLVHVTTINSVKNSAQKSSITHTHTHTHTRTQTHTYMPVRVAISSVSASLPYDKLKAATETAVQSNTYTEKKEKNGTVKDTSTHTRFDNSEKAQSNKWIELATTGAVS